MSNAPWGAADQFPSAWTRIRPGTAWMIWVFQAREARVPFFRSACLPLVSRGLGCLSRALRFGPDILGLLTCMSDASHQLIAQFREYVAGPGCCLVYNFFRPCCFGRRRVDVFCLLHVFTPVLLFLCLPRHLSSPVRWSWPPQPCPALPPRQRLQPAAPRRRLRVR